MAPPGHQAAPELTRRTTPAESAETLIRRAHALMATRGTHKSHTWVNKTVRAYLRDTSLRPFEQHLAEELDASVRRPLGYRDPTAERAARNVDRERGWPGNGPY